MPPGARPLTDAGGTPSRPSSGTIAPRTPPPPDRPLGNVPTAAEYDRFARQYQRSKELPVREHVEAFTFFELLGPLDGLEVLDLACGEGHDTRRLRRRGAARVVGVDLSRAMIDLAREQEAREPLGIEYLHAPAEEIGTIGAFDRVTAAFLLNCAPTRDHLERMCRTIAAILRPGGRFVSINSNRGPGKPADIARYGWAASQPEVPIVEGQTYRITFFLDPDRFEIQNTYHSHETYAEAFRKAGFRSLEWHPPRVSKAGRAPLEPGYWDPFLEAQPLIGIVASL